MDNLHTRNTLPVPSKVSDLEMTEIKRSVGTRYEFVSTDGQESVTSNRQESVAPNRSMLYGTRPSTRQSTGSAPSADVVAHTIRLTDNLRRAIETQSFLEANKPKLMRFIESLASTTDDEAEGVEEEKAADTPAVVKKMTIDQMNISIFKRYIELEGKFAVVEARTRHSMEASLMRGDGKAKVQGFERLTDIFMKGIEKILSLKKELQELEKEGKKSGYGRWPHQQGYIKGIHKSILETDDMLYFLCGSTLSGVLQDVRESRNPTPSNMKKTMMQLEQIIDYLDGNAYRNKNLNITSSYTKNLRPPIKKLIDFTAKSE